MTDQCLPIDPGPLCVDRLAALLRGGFPDLPGFPPSAPWGPDAAAGAPRGHWILPPGCKVFTGDQPDEMEPPACIIYQSDKSAPTRDDVRLFWLVPVSVEILVDRALDRPACQRLAQLLQLALCEDLRGSPVRERLSCPGLRVRFVRDVQVSLPELSDDWHPMFQLALTLHCSATASPDL